MMDFLNSSIGLLLVGFVCTGIVGAFLNSKIQTKAWERQKKHDLLLRSLADGRQLFDEITMMLNRRTFGLLKVLWAIEEGESADLVEGKWEEYYPTVRVWNETLQSLRFKTEAIAGPDVADRLLDYGDSAASETPNSIHYRMRRAHLAIREAKEIAKGDRSEQLKKNAKDQMNQLQAEIEDFSKAIAKELLYSEKTLREQV